MGERRSKRYREVRLALFQCRTRYICGVTFLALEVRSYRGKAFKSFTVGECAKERCRRAKCRRRPTMGRISQSRGSKRGVRVVLFIGVGRAMVGNVVCSFRSSNGLKRAQVPTSKFLVVKNVFVGVGGVVEGLRWARTIICGQVGSNCSWGGSP